MTKTKSKTGRWTSISPTEWRHGGPVHVSRETLNSPRSGSRVRRALAKRRKAQRRARMRLRVHRGRGCAG